MWKSAVKFCVPDIDDHHIHKLTAAVATCMHKVNRAQSPV